ncbi:MAG: transglycosylase domain-containing protein [Traorella sp.]
MRKWIKLGVGGCGVVCSGFLVFYLCAFLFPLDILSALNRVTIYDIHDDVIYESNFSKRVFWYRLEDYPLELVDFIVEIEDQRFYEHSGFDGIRILKALYNNILQGSIVEGGSSISQQMAKNMFLSNEQTLSRKIKELFYAVQMEMQYSKETILEGYLNTLYFGHGIYGFHDASEYYFDMPLEDCSVAQMVMMIGIINGPSIYSPYINYEASMNKTRTLIQYLYDNKQLDKTTYEKAIQENIILSTQTHQNDPNSYYIQAVLDQYQSMNIKKQNIAIYTTYDPTIQKALSESISQNASKDECETSGIILNPENGAIYALAGGKDAIISEYLRPLYSKRQVGSTIKPLLYYEALLYGFTPATQFHSSPTSFQIDDTSVYAPTNFDKRYSYRDISMINAISLSDNIYAMKTHMFLGENVLSDALEMFDIHVKPLPSIALGTCEMSLFELTSIYNTFANMGYYTKPSFIEAIYQDNELIYENPYQSQKYLKEDETLLLNQMLTSPYDIKNKTVSYPTLYNLEPNVKIAVKSGTSDFDSLIVGFNTEYTIGIWSGFDDGRFLESKYYNISKLSLRDTFNKIYQNQEGGWYNMTPNIEARIVDPITGETSLLGSEYWFIKE